MPTLRTFLNMQMKINKYFPFAFIYFFVNSVALPFGLTYTALLAPVFYIWILIVRKKELLLPFFTILAPFVFMQVLFVGVEVNAYFISLLNLVLVYIFCQAAYTFFTTCKEPEKIFRQLLILNFILCLIAIVIYFTPYYKIFWIEQNLTEGVTNFKRLKLLTYEASYYATLFTPIFFFFLLQYLLKQNTIRSGWLLLMIFLPYVLSFSLGVICCIIIAGFITWIVHFYELTKKKRVLNTIISAGTFTCVIMTITILFFRHNTLFIRIGNILSGSDRSGKGRTFDAFVIAERMLQEKSKYWGIGLGQVKILGEDIIRNFYYYPPDYPVAIPNAMAETLAIFGWTGFFLKLFIDIFLFFYTRVWNNYYRLMLFSFIFIYQFTGSFITNVAEYVIWILAFTNVFRQFDVEKKRVGAWQLTGSSL